MKFPLILITLLMGCVTLLSVIFTHPKAHSTSSMPTAQAVIELNMSPEKFTTVNQVDLKHGIDLQPVGLDFYSVDWPSTARGQVFLEHGPYSFAFPNTLGVTGTYDRSIPKKGLYVFHINGGMATQSDIYHDEARLRFLEFLAMLKQKGWRTFINLEDPRLPTHQALHYALQGDNILYSLPIDAEIDLNTWMQIKANDWRMYAGDAILKIGFRRDTSRLDLDKPSAYLFSYEIYNRQQLIMNQLSSEERKNAAQIWPERKLELEEKRLQKEALLELQGYHIDRSYIGPELNLKPSLD
ncbi:hypothetical protein [Sessilibacter corallicola]|uniref:hypothetical protein n=1 Tax=Sessilibacter corallicola TaxID=2904075 RepID=UPI001E29DB76|nr:hypothetical protein [Sessilibacter corallicola]MCE2026841.1 hypothetical protein [Sessilibacter corallicola]